MPVEPSVHMWVTFAIIAAGVASYVLERVSLELTSAAVVVALLLFFHFVPLTDAEGYLLLTTEDLLSGFANPALIAVLALLMIGQGLFQTGALEGPTKRIQQIGGNWPQMTLALTLLSAATISAFLNNTPVVVMFIPIVSSLSARLGVNPSKVLIPLSFITILGGMTTLIGSSTNLLVAGAVERGSELTVGFFDFFMPGLILAACGIVYVLLVGTRLLEPRQTLAAEVGAGGGRQFVAQIHITPGHPLEGQSPVAGLFPALKDMTVRLIQRGEHPILPPFEDVTLQPGDLVVVAATRSALADALKMKDTILTGDPEEAVAARNGDSVSEPVQKHGELTLAEAVVAPGSRVIGRRVEEIGLRAETGCVVLGLQRRSRMIRSRISEIRLEAGDVLLILGSRDNVRKLRHSRDLLLLEWSATELPDVKYANRARFIFLATVIAAASGIVPIVIAAMAGAAAMIPAGCLNIRQAARAINRSIYMLIGAALAMAAALEATNGAMYIAHSMVAALSGASAGVILSALFLLIAVMTNFLSNNATALLFTPIALSTALELGVDPAAFIHAVIFAANCSFATPMAYQTNLLVMGPGHYRFSDFVRTGTPLIFIIWLAYSLFAPWYYGL